MIGKVKGGGRGVEGLAGARTLEELETLFEDAFVNRDSAAVVELFEERAVFVADDGRVVRSTGEIERIASAMWDVGRTYVADARRVVQAHDLALIIGDRAINVARRSANGDWHYVIAFPFLGRHIAAKLT
jgi:ketosteroid isomerase-like protein